ncbi:MAG: substrate-binding domain-containing protein [Mariprofundaceae bacterium]
MKEKPQEGKVLRHWVLIIMFLAMALPVQAAERISVLGSTTVLPIVVQAAKAYKAIHPNLSITVSGGGSGVGIASMLQHTATLGMASRQPSESEAMELAGKARIVTIARDAVAVVVSRAVYVGGVQHLSLSQIADIYRGRVRNWKELGGPDAAIVVIDKEASRGTRHVFAKAVFGDAHARAPAASIITGSNNEEQAIVARSDQAIGMLSNAWLNDAVRAVAVGEGQAAVLPTLEHVADGSYPIQRGLHVLLPDDASEATRAFVDFLLSDAGQAIVEDVGYLPAG